MIKGSERRIVVVERPEDPVFERAVFYVRVGVRPVGRGPSLSDQAQELCDRMQGEERGRDEMESRVVAGKKKAGARRLRNKKQRKRMALVGGAAAAAATALAAVSMLIK